MPLTTRLGVAPLAKNFALKSVTARSSWISRMAGRQPGHAVAGVLRVGDRRPHRDVLDVEQLRLAGSDADAAALVDVAEQLAVEGVFGSSGSSSEP
jgi:hypothetical protein